MVYDDAEELYTQVAKDGTGILEEALEVLLGHSIPLLNAPLIKSRARGSILALNTTPFPRWEVVELPLGGGFRERFRGEVVQVSEDRKRGYVMMDGTRGAGLAVAKGIYEGVKAANGESSWQFSCWSFFSVGPMAFNAALQTSSGDFVLKNSNIEMKISKEGRIVSLFDIELESVFVLGSKEISLTDRTCLFSQARADSEGAGWWDDHL